MTVVIDEVRVLVACGRLDEALASLDDVLARDPQASEALLLKASVLFERRREGEALPLFRAAVLAAPRSAEARNLLARCLHAIGDNDEALHEAQVAREVLGEGENFRETAPVYLTLLWCLRALGRLPEAVAVAEEGLLRCPDAVLAQWATVVEEELAQAEEDRC